MARKRLMWQFLPWQILLSFVSLGALMWFMAGAIHDAWLDRTVADLEVRARLTAQLIAERGPAGLADAEADRLCKETGRAAHTRITLIRLSGRVVGDTDEPPATMDDHSDRPEIQQAFADRVGTSIRFSQTLREKHVYVAVPWRRGGEIVGAVRVSLSLSSAQQLLRAVYLSIFVAGALITLVTVVVAWGLSRKVSRRLEFIRRGAERFARGDFSQAVPLADTEELAALAETMNRMAADLDDRIRTVTQQRNEREAIFASMGEGLIAVDADGGVIALNDAAADLLQADRTTAVSRNIHELIRSAPLQRFVARSLAAQGRAEEEIVLNDERPTVLDVRATPLRATVGADDGALIVLSDVTHLRRLEGIRRDFVANVSHELRTPITSIKGFAETLLDGALDDKDDARRFLTILARQADRLNAIIEDLLALSRIEQDAQDEQVPMEEIRLRDVLDSALDLCESRAVNKGVRLDLDCDASLVVRANAALLEQAVVNLIDNAVKYSDADQTVEISARSAPNGATVSVCDHGCGIAQEHHARLFERFYRVDKARSRELGGTGLGLAIVKHVARAHGGGVSVDSEPDRGSRFTISIPATGNTPSVS